MAEESVASGSLNLGGGDIAFTAAITPEKVAVPMNADDNLTPDDAPAAIQTNQGRDTVASETTLEEEKKRAAEKMVDDVINNETSATAKKAKRDALSAAAKRDVTTKSVDETPDGDQADKEDVGPAPESNEKKDETDQAAPDAATAPRRGRPPFKKSTPASSKRNDSKTKQQPMPKKSPMSSSSWSPTQRESKRVRKAAETFVPDNFAYKNRSVDVIVGRGVKLADIAPVAASIESVPMQKVDDALQALHKLVYHKGSVRPVKADIKPNLLEFSGYLPPEDKSLSLDEQEKADEDIETKMSTKAYKLKLPDLKAMIDVLHVDRSGVYTKDELVDLLLNFLGAPDITYCKGHLEDNDDQPTSKKKQSRKGVGDGDGDDDDDDDDGQDYDDVSDGGAKVKHDDDDDNDGDDDAEEGMPTKTQLRKWVRAYVRCFNMRKATVKDALELCSDKFGVDVSSRKDVIKKLIVDEM